MNVLEKILSLKKQNKKTFAVLIDPDKFENTAIIDAANTHKVDFVFVGGSLITKGNLHDCIAQIKSKTNIPIVIFPGSSNHVSGTADAILLLSLISGRNPEYLIGQHVQAAPTLKKLGVEIIATGYILIDGGIATTVSYISNTSPIPANKPEVAAVTAMAGEMIGNKIIYLDAGSGALQSINANTIKAVADVIETPLIVGGGIRTAHAAKQAWAAGADILVVGNAIETNPNLLAEIIEIRNGLN